MIDYVINDRLQTCRELTSQLRVLSNPRKVDNWLKELCEQQQWLIEHLYERIKNLEEIHEAK